MYHSIIISKELRGYLPKLCRILNGEGGGLYQEKLRSQGTQTIYSLRINISDRLLYTTIMVNGASCILVLCEVKSHDYQKSKFLRSTGALSHYLRKHGEAIEAALNGGDENASFIALSAAEENAVENLSVATNDDVMQDYYPLKMLGTRHYWKDPRQEACLQNAGSQTVILSGSSGTGKTVSAMFYLQSHAGAVHADGSLKKYLFVTLNQFLVDAVRAQLSSALDDEQLSCITFSTYEGLVRTSRAAAATRFMTYDEVHHYILNTLCAKNFNIEDHEFAGAKDKLEAIRVIHDEWILIAGGQNDDLAAYRRLGADQSYVKNQDVRAFIHRAYLEFKRSLQEDEIYLPLHKFDGSSEHYDGVIIDEAFLLSFSNVCGLSDRAEFTMLLGDSHQAVRAHWLSVFSAYKGGVEHIVLEENQRNPYSVITFLNRVLKVKFHLRPGLRDKYEQGEIPIANSLSNVEDGVLWINEEWCSGHGSEVENWVGSTQFAVVILCDEEQMSLDEITQKKARARAIFNTPLIFTRKEIQGLEYSVVVVIIDESINQLSNELGRGFAREIAASAVPTNRAAQKGVTIAQQVAMTMSNQLYVACSRAQRQLLVYVDDAAINAQGQELLDYFKGTNSLANVAAPVMPASTSDDWQQEHQRQIEQNNPQVAKEIVRHTQVAAGVIGNNQSNRQQRPANATPLNGGVAGGGAASSFSSSAPGAVTVPNSPPTVVVSAVPDPLVAPKSFKADWKSLVQSFQLPGRITIKNVDTIINSAKNNDLLNWVLFVAEVKEGEGESVFFKYVGAGLVAGFLKKLIPHLNRITPLGLNHLSTSERHRNQSLAYFLCSSVAGCFFLLNNLKFAAKISSAALNAILPATAGVYAGTSAVFHLCSTPGGLSILLNSSDLAAKISLEALNAILPATAGKEAGKSAVNFLCGTVEGHFILLNNSDLAAKISPSALNAILPATVGKLAGMSPVYFLCCTAEGNSILLKKPDLVSKISPEALNEILPATAGNDAGKSAALFLCTSAEGCALLLSNPDLVSMISSKALNAILPATAREDAGTSAAYFLCSTAEGRALLLKNSDLVSMISSKALNAILPATARDDAGKSAADYLRGTAEGRALLESNSTLATKISPATSQVTSNISTNQGGGAAVNGNSFFRADSAPPASSMDVTHEI